MLKIKKLLHSTGVVLIIFSILQSSSWLLTLLNILGITTTISVGTIKNEGHTFTKIY